MADYAQRIATEWHQRAGELAAWVLAHMVNRTDVWGRYVRRRSDTGEMGVVTAPFRDERGKVFLDEDSLKKHFNHNGNQFISKKSNGAVEGLSILRTGADVTPKPISNHTVIVVHFE